MSRVLGIDLGTSTSSVAIIQDGQPFIIPDQEGRTIHPSIVHFKENGTIVVGEEAKEFVITDPANTVSSAKRLIGRKYFSAEVKKAKALMPYEIIEGENKSVLLAIRDNQYTLQEISAMILRKMKALAENHFEESFEKAVITVPAYFNDNQRAATVDAGRIAGLDVLRIINEPTAAALACGFGKGLNERVAVYDLGGGTFDISVLELSNDVFEVISTSGDTYLGGDDFDDRIMDHLADAFMAKHEFDPRSNRECLQRLKAAAEKAKIGLSDNNDVQVFIPALTAGEHGFLDLDVTISGSKFEELTQDLIQRSFKVCDEALQTARLTVSDIDGIILVGGSSKSPVIHQYVKAYFQKEPQSDVEPQVVVAKGAAIQGAALAGQSNDVVLIDLTPLSLGIGIRGGLVEPIIEINTPVPADHTKLFSTSQDDQDKVVIPIYQGEGRRAEDNELLGELTLSGLPPAQAGSLNIAVQFEVDTNGILNVVAQDESTGATQSTKIEASGRLSEDKIQELKERASRRSQEQDENAVEGEGLMDMKEVSDEEDEGAQ